MNRETIIQGLFRRPMDPDPEADAVKITDIILYSAFAILASALTIIIGVLLSGWMPGWTVH